MAEMNCVKSWSAERVLSPHLSSSEFLGYSLQGATLVKKTPVRFNSETISIRPNFFFYTSTG